MKTMGIISAGLIFISTSLSAQITVKTDSLNQVTTKLNRPLDSNQIKIQKQAEINQPKPFSPNENRKSTDFPYAMMTRQKSRHFNDPVYRMPVVKPPYQSNMPVMKPDSTIHFHLKIKKFDLPRE